MIGQQAKKHSLHWQEPVLKGKKQRDIYLLSLDKRFDWLAVTEFSAVWAYIPRTPVTPFAVTSGIEGTGRNSFNIELKYDPIAPIA